MTSVSFRWLGRPALFNREAEEQSDAFGTVRNA